MFNPRVPHMHQLEDAKAAGCASSALATQLAEALAATEAKLDEVETDRQARGRQLLLIRVLVCVTG